MRKWFSIILILILSFTPIMAFAAQAPLDVKGRNVYVPDESDIELVSYNVFFRIRTGYSSINTSMVVKNPNSDQTVTIRMGIPVQMDGINKFRDISILSDGKQVKSIQRSNLKNPPTDNEIDVKKWYTWDVALDPNESKIVECSFSIDNRLEADGTETIIYPLNHLGNWAGNKKKIQIIADLDFYGPYVFDPMPSITPTQYDNGGRLTFNLDNSQSIPSTFELSFKPIDTVITKYIEDNSDGNNYINDILKAYNNKNYYNAITLIHQFLSDSNDTEIMAEIKYLEALCYQNLYEIDKALNLLNQLETDPGFGETLSPTIKNKIIYDKATILRSQPDGEQNTLEYLISVRDSIADNSIFAMWMDQDITMLTPTTVEDEPVEEDSNALESGETEEEDNNESIKVIDKISIGKYEFYIEEILVMALILIVLIFVIIKIIKRKRRRRSSIFR